MRRGQESLYPGPLPATGTYTIVVHRQEEVSWTLSLVLLEPIADTLEVGGSPVSVELESGQETRLSFKGTEGQRVSLNLDGTIVYGDRDVSLVRPIPWPGEPYWAAALSILDPDEKTLHSTSLGQKGGNLDAYAPVMKTTMHTEPLPAAGTYTVVVTSRVWEDDCIFTLSLSEPVYGTLAVGGPAMPIELTKPGQCARLSFEGTEGQRVSLKVAGDHGLSVWTRNPPLPWEGEPIMRILDPDGMTFLGYTVRRKQDSQQVFDPLSSLVYLDSDNRLETDPLPATGTYIVVVTPGATRPYAFALTLDHVE